MKLLSLMILIFVPGVLQAQQQDSLWLNYLNKGINYSNRPDFDSAIYFLRKSHKQVRLTKDPEGKGLSKTAYFLGRNFMSLRQFDSASFYLEQSLTEARNFETPKPGELSAPLGAMAELNLYLGKYQKARSLFEEATAHTASNFGKDHPEYGLALQNLAIFEYQMGNYSQALTWSEEATVNTKKNYGADHLEYANALNSQGNIYIGLGDFEKAVNVLSRSEEIVGHQLGKDHPNYGTRVNNLALAYKGLGNYSQALPLYEQALEISLKIYGKNHGDYVISLSNLAALYHEISDFDEAFGLLKEAVEISRRVVGQQQFSHGITLNNYGEVAMSKGDLETALRAFLEAEEVVTNSVGKTHPEYATILNNLASVYRLLGRMDKALDFFSRSVELTKKHHGDSHPFYGVRLSNLGSFWAERAEYDKALPYLEAAVSNLELSIGKQHPYYSKQLTNLARIYLRLHRYDSAMAHANIALDLLEKAVGKDHLSYSQCLSLLGEIYYYQNQPEEAIPYLTQSYDIAVSLLGKSHYEVGHDLNSLAVSYFRTGQNKKALDYVRMANINLQDQINHVFLFGSERDKKQFLRTVYQFDLHQNIGLASTEFKADFNKVNLNSWLLLNGLILNSSKDILTNLRTKGVDSIDSKIVDLTTTRAALSKELSLLLPLRNLDVDSLSEAANELESQLVRLYSQVFNDNLSIAKDWSKIRNELKEDEIAIEFAHFIDRENGDWVPRFNYVAYLTKSNSVYPELVWLFHEEQLSKIVSGKSADQLYTFRGGKSHKTIKSSTQDSLYQLVWQKLEPHIQGINTIYYATSGQLHQVPLAALSKYGTLISNKYEMVQLSTTDVINKQVVEPSRKSALLIGGIRYNQDTTGLHIKEKFDSLSSLEVTRGPNDNSSLWRYLPGTNSEVSKLSRIMSRKNVLFETWTEGDATEKAFKALSGQSPEILHIATHGFFFESPKKNLKDAPGTVFSIANDPLLRSGLVLAGGNYAWENGTNRYREEDGILTSLEISNLDLSNTDLVVLSACDTGLGAIDRSEGVYGLQRAFRMAGVQNIIMSLWEVPDKETAEFMVLFYKNWFGGNTIRRAFNDTQRAMSKKYKEEPQKWAGFVLVN